MKKTVVNKSTSVPISSEYNSSRGVANNTKRSRSKTGPAPISLSQTWTLPRGSTGVPSNHHQGIQDDMATMKNGRFYLTTGPVRPAPLPPESRQDFISKKSAPSLTLSPGQTWTLPRGASSHQQNTWEDNLTTTRNKTHYRPVRTAPLPPLPRQAQPMSRKPVRKAPPPPTFHHLSTEEIDLYDAPGLPQYLQYPPPPPPIRSYPPPPPPPPIPSYPPSPPPIPSSPRPFLSCAVSQLPQSSQVNNVPEMSEEEEDIYEPAPVVGQLVYKPEDCPPPLPPRVSIISLPPPSPPSTSTLPSPKPPAPPPTKPPAPKPAPTIPSDIPPLPPKSIPLSSTDNTYCELEYAIEKKTEYNLKHQSYSEFMNSPVIELNEEDEDEKEEDNVYTAMANLVQRNDQKEEEEEEEEEEEDEEEDEDEEEEYTVMAPAPIDYKRLSSQIKTPDEPMKFLDKLKKFEDGAQVLSQLPPKSTIPELPPKTTTPSLPKLPPKLFKQVHQELLAKVAAFDEVKMKTLPKHKTSAPRLPPPPPPDETEAGGLYEPIQLCTDDEQSDIYY